MIGLNPEKPKPEREITTAGQLLVEGRSQEMFFREMIRVCGLEEQLQAWDFGDNSRINLTTKVKFFTQKVLFKEKVRTLGIIRDAEEGPGASAFQSVQHALRDASLPVPSKINFLEGAPLSVGVYILPDCQNAGMLETLCLAAIEESEHADANKVLPCVDEFFKCVAGRGRKPENPEKARVAGYVLALDVIDPQLGRAAQRNKLPWSAKAFDPLKQFLRKVAGSPASLSS